MFQIHEATSIQRFKNGVKLKSCEDISPDTNQYAMNLLNFPFNVYFSDLNSALVLGNECIATSHHIASLSDIQGASVHHFISDKADAQRMIENDKRIIETGSFQFYEEEYVFENKKHISLLSFKMPLYNEHNTNVGLLGFSTLLDGGIKKVTNFLAMISKSGLLNTDESGLLNLPYTSSSPRVREIDGNVIAFTKREFQILNLTSQNLTAKEISRILSISHRTVETHIDNLKWKANVSSKKALIEKVLNY